MRAGQKVTRNPPPLSLQNTFTQTIWNYWQYKYKKRFSTYTIFSYNPTNLYIPCRPVIYCEEYPGFLVIAITLPLVTVSHDIITVHHVRIGGCGRIPTALQNMESALSFSEALTHLAQCSSIISKISIQWR